MKITPNFRIMRGAPAPLSLGFPKNSLLLILLIFGLGLNAEQMPLPSEPLFQANVYLQDNGKLIFSQTNEVAAYADSTVLTHKYFTPQGELAALDEAVLQGADFKRAFTKFYQVGEAGEVKRQGSKMLMRFQQDDERKQKLLDFPEELIVGPLFNNFVQRNWQTLVDGTNLHFKLPAPEVMQIATFTLRQVGSDYANDNQVAFKLSPTNLILKLFISASYFVYDRESRRLEAIHGNSILKTEIDGSFTRTTNVDIYFRYLKPGGNDEAKTSYRD
ncbi:MAG: hypothetical protein R6U84_07150 [Candidatus Cloacimonadales bacterium]